MSKKIFTVSSLYLSKKYVPFVKFGGKWLNSLGFEIGDKLNVTIENNKIILEKISDNEKDLLIKEKQIEKLTKQLCVLKNK